MAEGVSHCPDHRFLGMCVDVEAYFEKIKHVITPVKIKLMT